MLRNLRNLFSLGVLALAPALGIAETVILRNDTAVPVIVQGTCVVNGKVVRGRAIQLQPGDTANIILPGNKIITIHDARPPLPLLKASTVPAAKEDQYLSIQADTPTKAKLEPYTPPSK